MLVESVRHPEVAQGDIQLLLWGVLSRSKISTMAPKLQATARALLTAAQIREIDGSALDLIPASERGRLFRSLPRAVHDVAEREAQLRDQFGRGVYNYDEIQRVAVLSGVAPEDNTNRLKRGQWARHPGGYWIRYFPDGFPTMRVEIMVPDRVTIRRDRLNRIVSIEDGRGGRTETEYDDTVPARAAPGDSRLRAYAFKTIRLTRVNPAGGAPRVVEIHNKGWVFVRSRPKPSATAPAPLFAFSTIRRAPDWTAVAQDPFGDWAGRYERARELHDRYEYYRDRAEAARSAPSSDSVDELEDTEHYRDGVDAALDGDLNDRLEWLVDHQELENAALRYATSVIDTLPTTSSADDVPVIDVTPRDRSGPTWEPAGGLAVPSGGGQRLGISGRAH